METTHEGHKIQINPGDAVCLTKLAGINQQNFEIGVQLTGQLSREGICVGERLVVIGAIETSTVIDVFISISCMVIRTRNSVYLLERVDGVHRY